MFVGGGEQVTVEITRRSGGWALVEGFLGNHWWWMSQGEGTLYVWDFDTSNYYRTFNLDLPVAPNSFDVCTSALFLHHLTDGEATTCIGQMRRVASAGIIVNDIHRHSLSYHGIRLATTVLPFSRMVRHDAPVSVRRAFTLSDMRQLARAAGVERGIIRWFWAFRWVLTDLPQD